MPQESTKSTFTGTFAVPDFAGERAARVEEQLDQIVRTYQANDFGADPVRDSAIREGLNRACWELAEVLAWGHIQSHRDSDPLPVDRVPLNHRLLLDAGFLDADLCGIDREALLRALEVPEGPTPVAPALLHNYLADIAARVFHTKQIEDLRGQIARAEEQLASSAHALDQGKKAHQTLLSSLQSDPRVLELETELEVALPALATLKAIPVRQYTADMHRDSKRLMETWNRLRAAQAELVDTYVDRKALGDGGLHCLNLLTAAIRNQRRLDDLRASLADTARTAQGLSSDHVLTMIHQEFEYIRRVLRRANKQDPRAAPQFILQGHPTWTPAAVHLALAETCAIDAPLATAWKSGSWPKPRIVIIPGTGTTSYDSARRTIWVPLAGREQASCSFRRAMGLYRYHHDLDAQDTFRRLEPFHHLTHPAQLADQFAWAYMTYLTTEARGFRKLTTEVVKWFAAQFNASP